MRNSEQDDILQYGSAPADTQRDKVVEESNGEPVIEDISSPSGHSGIEANEEFDRYKEMLKKKLDDGMTTPSMSRILSPMATIILSSECQEIN